MNINVTKRNGSVEPFNLDKVHKVLEWACDDLANVSVSEIELRANIQLYDGIKAYDIHELLIKSAAELISEQTPNYQFVAARLVNYKIRKEAYGQYEPIHLLDLVKKNIELGVYDQEITEQYTEDEFDILNKHIRHDRDYNFAYAGMEQFRGKYLVQDRSTKVPYESPQMAYMLISMTLFSGYTNGQRLKWVKDFYDAISQFYISLPTPIMAGVRTPTRQFSSCVLIESGDSLDSINATATSVVRYISKRAGIGIGVGAIRAIGSKVKNGSIVHTGLIPFLKYFHAAVKSCSQGSIRGGAATVYFPLWHYEFEDLVVLKNNKGTEENRIRHLDYAFQFNKVMYERLLSGGDITFFSPSDVPGLYEAFYADQDEFRRLYEKYEKSRSIRKKTMKAIDVFSQFLQERKETGRIYLMNVDHANEHGSFDPKVAPVHQSNLCCLTGDTMIDVKYTDVQHGDIKKIKTLREVVMEVVKGSDVRVLSYDHENNKQVYSKITAAALTRKNAELVKVVDTATNKSVICTPDHKFFVSWGSNSNAYMNAEVLQNSDKLLIKDQLENKTVLSKIGKLFGYGDKKQDKEHTQVVKLNDKLDVYDITVEGTHNFFANDILVHNCEIDLPTKPLNSADDDEAEISLCTLSAINWGLIHEPGEFEKYCTLAVRALDALLDYQDYPVPAAMESTFDRRPLGVGIINLAYFLAKRGYRYDENALEVIDEYAEAWSYYLIKASVDLAKEKGSCLKSNETKYSMGLMPNDTYKKEVDELVPHVERCDWNSLRKDAKEYGIRNSTLMALMPSETSSQLSNATNGIEPPRSLVSYKQSKDGVMAQVVPGFHHLKNKYDLLWDQPNPEGYLKICAVLQKYVDQGISVNTSYNPEKWEDGKIPMSQMIKDLVTFYKFGGKQLYYFQTYDGAGELKMGGDTPEAEEDCESCKL